MFAKLAVCVSVAVAWFTDSPRVYSVADLHGDYYGVMTGLRTAGLINVTDNWAGGNSILVQLGDVFDRGLYTEKILHTFMRLGKEAEKAGGRIVHLMGNHEYDHIYRPGKCVIASDEMREFVYGWKKDYYMVQGHVFMHTGVGLYSRFYAHAPDSEACPAVGALLRHADQSAVNLVIGHTTVHNVTARCNGQILLTDVGSPQTILRHYPYSTGYEVVYQYAKPEVILL
jgi:hypothetical protein